jgi:FkbM family methyltransferase
MAWGMDNMHLPFLETKIRPGQIIYDVGANCGQMSLFLSRQVRASGRVFAFEPVEENARVARQNMALNGMNNVEIHELALAEAGGAREFLYDPSRHTMGVLADACVKLPGETAARRVRCDTIDHLIAKGLAEPDLLKIDVEGAAAAVVAGAKDLLKRKKPSLFIELHATSRQSPEILLLKELRENHGYVIHDVGGTLMDEPHIDWSGLVWCEPPAIPPPSDISS